MRGFFSALAIESGGRFYRTSPFSMKPPRLIRKLYHHTRWVFFSAISGGTVGETSGINPADLVFGQLPTSQFPRGARRIVREGDWDTEVIAIEEHSVYRSMHAHFVNGTPWQETPHFHEAVEGIRAGAGFRGSRLLSEITPFFQEWDMLYERIQTNGFLSMREMLRQRLIDNPCKRLDEITVNLSREGRPLLNDGWHRFCIARILGIQSLPVRILARHQSYHSWKPAGSGKEQDVSSATDGA